MTTRDKVYDYIVEYKRTHDGNSPTLYEIVDNTPCSSTSHAKHHLLKLKKEGLIMLGNDKSARAIFVVGGEWKIK